MVKKKQSFYKTVINIALPVTLQSLLQSSFGVVDQVMTGQLGSSSIAGIGLGGKFSSVYLVLVSAIAAVAGIMIAQYMGRKDERGVGRSFCVNLLFAVITAAFFTGICTVFPEQIMSIYTKDTVTREIAARYLRITALSFIPTAVTLLSATLLRCREAASRPLYAGIFAAVINTGLNYALIFGKFGFPALGVTGAALATVISQAAGCVLTVILLMNYDKKRKIWLAVSFRLGKSGRKQYLEILLPILMCELFWSLGENVYAMIYGNMGTKDCAAMTLTIPVQSLTIGALSGLSQAAAILIGKALGSGEYERACREARKLMWYGFGGSVMLSVLLAAAGGAYVNIYQVEKSVQTLAYQILIAFAIISPIKVQNMILGGGILRSGGKTKYVMGIDFIGTWIFGVPLGFLAAFVWKLKIPYVYFILSLEECVRFGISLAVFQGKRWMENIGGNEEIRAG